MTGATKLPGVTRVQMPARYYLGQQTLNAPANVALTLPSLCDTVIISAETAACYYSINALANANSGGFVATGTYQVIGPVANLTSLSVNAPGGVVHAQYFCER